jgi:hypothetical protein
LRSLLRDHQNAVVETVPLTTFTKAAKAFGLLAGKKLMLESNDELTILFDHIIYDRSNRGRIPVQRYLAKLPPTQDQDEELVRRAMEHARFSIFELEEVHPGRGVAVRDRVRGGEPLFVVDEALSSTVRAKRLFAFRLLPFPNYWMTSGGGFPLRRSTVTAATRLLFHVLRLTGGGDLTYLSPEAEQELARVVIGIGFEEGTTSEIKYR